MNQIVWCSKLQLASYFETMVGVAARRIKCYVKPGDRVEAGQKIGLMYFGSRVDLYLPANIRLKIGPGQKVKGGLTVIGEIEHESQDLKSQFQPSIFCRAY